ncbi:MAG: DUF935 family protein [Sumerlaeia bacterium]
MNTELTRPSRNPAEDWRASILEPDGGTRATLALLETEAASGRGHHRSVYELFNEMEEKDGHLYAVLQTRVVGLMGLRAQLRPGGDAPADRAAADFVRRALDDFPRFEGFLRALCDALPKGFAAIELIWTYDAQGRLTIKDWIAHAQEGFAMGTRGELLLLSPPFATGSGAPEVRPAPGRAYLPAQSHLRPPERKFVVARFGAGARHPYGRGLCQRAYWPYWFKKNCLKFWSIYNEKFGAPTAVATYPAGTPEDERKKLLEVLESLATDTGVVIPESVKIEFIEASRSGGSGGAAAFRELAEYCNDEISKVVLGATLTASEGRRSGSLALGNVHESVRQDYIESDARWLAQIVNGSLVRWLTELNFPGAKVPLWSLDPTPPQDLEQQVRIDRELIALGVPLPLDHFYERYGRARPKDDGAALSFDDRNLFGYHLQFGILTVNEARQRLGLAPVPWGENPVRDPRLTPQTLPPIAGETDRHTADRQETEEPEPEPIGR